MGDQDPDSAEGTDFLLADEAAAKGGHPAWQEILDSVPEEYRPALLPTLEKWDKGVANRFQSLHSQYEPFKNIGLDADQLEAARNLMAALEEDPRSVYDLMAQTYGFSAEQGASDNGSETVAVEDDDPVAARIAALELQNQQLLAGQQQLTQAQQEQQAADQLDAYMEYLHNEHGDFDDDYIIGLLANGVDGDEAISRYTAIVERATGASQDNGTEPVVLRTAPVVMSAGGGVPSNAIDPKTLDRSQTQDLVAQILAQSAGN